MSGLAERLVKFHAVGGLGILVQVAALAALKSGLGLNYLPATAAAVEIAVIHNFVWHERFTWSDRRGGGTLLRLLRFNVSNGLISIVGNLALMRLLAGRFRMHYLAANLIAIAACSILNFLASDIFVFRNVRKRSETPYGR